MDTHEVSTHAASTQHVVADSVSSSDKIGRMPFPRAALCWLDTREGRISPKTFHEYKLNLKPLGLFFGEMRLQDITADQIRGYQKFRLQNCGPFAINHECSILQQMLKRIGRWDIIESNYEPLKLPTSLRGRALSEEEYDRLFNVASSNPNWEAAYLFAVISVNTSAGPKEALTLRLKDVDVAQQMITVQPGGAKNVFRIRRIPLNPPSLEALKLALARANRLGSCQPEHYIFPFRVNKGNTYDPMRHQTTLKSAWRALIKEAGIANFRMYDLRHHAITVLLENREVSDETAEAIAGHISPRMKKRYSHIRFEVMRNAVHAIQNARVVRIELRNQDVLDLLDAGLSAEIISAKIKNSGCVFETSPQTLRSLKERKVPDSVILAMIRTGAA